jgi:hexosaminidase
LGSGPDNQSGGGYLTRADYIDLVRYAQAHFIEVIPEFDMPAPPWCPWKRVTAS